MTVHALTGFARLLAAAVLAGGCATSSGRTTHAASRSGARVASASRDSDALRSQTGMASFYGGEHAGRRTASGEPFDPKAMTAAHRTLPFGTRVRVTNLGNGRSVVVRINDRGPFRKARIVDVSRAAAKDLHMIQSGVAKVKLEVVREVASSD